jgi:hypothetical protein
LDQSGEEWRHWSGGTGSSGPHGRKNEELFKQLALGTAVAGCGLVGAMTPVAQAEDTNYAAADLPDRTVRLRWHSHRQRHADYLNMLNERDGGIGGVKLGLKSANRLQRPKGR